MPDQRHCGTGRGWRNKAGGAFEDFCWAQTQHVAWNSVTFFLAIRPPNYFKHPKSDSFYTPGWQEWLQEFGHRIKSPGSPGGNEAVRRNIRGSFDLPVDFQDLCFYVQYEGHQDFLGETMEESFVQLLLRDSESGFLLLDWIWDRTLSNFERAHLSWCELSCLVLQLYSRFLGSVHINTGWVAPPTNVSILLAPL